MISPTTSASKDNRIILRERQAVGEAARGRSPVRPQPGPGRRSWRIGTPTPIPRNVRKAIACPLYPMIYIYIYMVVDQNSFIRERPFFANKNFTFAKLWRTPCLSFAGPMLANNTSYEDSFTTCQITPENHGSLLGSLLNMQVASRNPFPGQVFFATFTGPPPSTCTLTFARSFA